MSIVDGFAFEPMIGDPDDHRPGSVWAVAVDSGDPAGRVESLAVLFERIGPGERIPAHVHRVDEVILPDGPGRFRLGDEVRRVAAGTAVFIRAGTVHGFENDGLEPLPVRAVYPTTKVWLRYVERNPAPGTEADAPGAGFTYDFRTGEVTAERDA